MIDILRAVSGDASVSLKLAQISAQLDAAATVEEFKDIVSENQDIFDVDSNLLQFIDYKIKIGNEIEHFARNRKYPSSALKCALNYLPLIEDATDMNTIENIGIKLENNVVLLENTKAEYLQKVFETYLDEQGKLVNISEVELMQIYYGILYASNETEIVEAFISLTLDSVKKTAKEAIDEAAGENQSAAMNKIVKKAKAAIEAATTKDDVETAKQNGLIAIENQLIKEAEEAAALAQAKTEAKKSVDEAAGENPSETVANLAQAAKELIDAAETVEEVNETKEKWIAVIEKAISDEAAALKEAKAAAKSEIKKAADGVIDDTSAYENEIDELDNITDVIGKLTEIIGKINAEKTGKAIKTALAELERATSALKTQKAREVADAAKVLIQNAQSEDEVNTVLADALQKIADAEAEAEPGEPDEPTKPEKKSFWDQIVAFFKMIFDWFKKLFG